MRVRVRVLLTGGCGFIGSAVIRHIIRSTDHSVVNVDSGTYLGSKDALALEETATQQRHTLVRADNADHATMTTLFAAWQPDAVMHLAAEEQLAWPIHGPGPFARRNVCNTHTLLDTARTYWEGLPAERRARFRFHYASTDQTFGALGHAAPPLTETTPYDARCPCAATEATSDRLVRAWNNRYGLPTLISNAANNFGPWQLPGKLIPLVTLNAIEGRPLLVDGDGSNLRDWIFVEDHAEALLQVLERGEPGSTYGISARQSRSDLQVVRGICAVLDACVPDLEGPRERLITFGADRLCYDFRSAIAPDTSAQSLGWHAAHNFERGLGRTVAWYLETRKRWEWIRYTGLASLS